MRFEEITEAQPIKPLTPEKARDRAAKMKSAQDKMSDIRAQAAIKINAARRKANAL